MIFRYVCFIWTKKKQSITDRVYVRVNSICVIKLISPCFRREKSKKCPWFMAESSREWWNREGNWLKPAFGFDFEPWAPWTPVCPVRPVRNPLEPIVNLCNCVIGAFACRNEGRALAIFVLIPSGDLVWFLLSRECRSTLPTDPTGPDWTYRPSGHWCLIDKSKCIRGLLNGRNIKCLDVLHTMHGVCQTHEHCLCTLTARFQLHGTQLL